MARGFSAFIEIGEKPEHFGLRVKTISSSTYIQLDREDTEKLIAFLQEVLTDCWSGSTTLDLPVQPRHKEKGS